MGSGRAPSKPSFDDCLARVDRADAHLKELGDRLNALRKGSAHAVSAHVDPQTVPGGPRPQGSFGYPVSLSGQDPKELVIIGHRLTENETRDASLVIADAVSCLRAALDSAVWYFSTRRRIRPAPAVQAWRAVRWPVVLEERDWSSTRGSSLRFVTSTGVRAVIEQAQPFSRRKRHPRGDEFAVLDQLWNLSKHRHLPFAQTLVGLDRVRSNLADHLIGIEAPDGARESAQKHAFATISERRPGPFEDGVELGRVREVGPVYSMWPHKNVDAALAIEVLFKNGPPAYGRPVENTMAGLRRAVALALESLKPFV